MKYYETYTIIRELYSNKIFDKNDIMKIAKTTNKVNSEKTLRNIIGIFKNNNLIKEVSKGKYVTANKNIYIYKEDDIELKIHKAIKKEYPELNFIVWNSKKLNEFTLHYITSNYIIVETEKFAIEAIVSFLSELNFKKFNVVTQDMFNNYRDIMDSQKDLIIVKPLHTKAPLVDNNKISIEKIMVDLYIDKLYLAYQGKELERIYENIFDKYDIDFLKLINYAKVRMSNINNYEQFINSLNIPEKYKSKR